MVIGFVIVCIVLFILWIVIPCIQDTFLLMKEGFQGDDSFPKYVHLIYIPWERETGKRLENENDFDHTFYKTFIKTKGDWKVRLWTLSKVNRFLEEKYPEYKDIWKKVKHPTQVVDFLRLLITYHYGGLYWQYDSPKQCHLDRFIPSSPARCHLFVEKILTKPLANEMKKERLRKNKPEERVRISFGCFAANPKDPFLHYCIKKSWKNLNTLDVQSQYDILYIGANAMFSEAYHEYPKKNTIELTYNTKDYISFVSKGSWRLNTYH